MSQTVIPRSRYRTQSHSQIAVPSDSWHRLATLPTGITVQAVSFSTALRGVIATSGGRVFATKNGGHTWIATRLAGIDVVSTLIFGDSRHGYLLATTPTTSGLIHTVLWRTTDAGQTWRLIPSTTAPTHIAALATPNGTELYALGQRGAESGLWRSTNSGLTWTLMSTASLDALDGFSFPTVESGWATTGGSESQARQLAHTSDGGISWALEPMPVNVSRLVAPSANRVYVYGTETPTILRSDNGGVSWRREVVVPYQLTSQLGEIGSVIGMPPAWIADVQFATANIGAALTTQGIAITSDGGRHWRTIPLPQISHAWDAQQRDISATQYMRWAGHNLIAVSTADDGTMLISRIST